MCGRYQLALAGKNKLFGYRFGLDEQATLQLKDNYNVAPSQTMPVVVKHSSNSIQMMLWGLIPSWSKDGKSLVINARSETLSVKPMFKKLLETHRCIIPSTGFYEWKKTSEGKQPFYIGLKNHEFFGFAGVYDIWNNPKGEQVYSYVIITCNSNKTISQIHNRMPVILKKEDEEKWLKPDSVEEEKLLPYLKPFPDKLMTAYSISNRVNSSINSNMEIDKPVKTSLFD
jgi:putative SOS response-associated peptidase YedK